tara:strand:+ start:757 stop:1164 length:408 start_codon:yes stop_codon:yes gene_type:complete
MSEFKLSKVFNWQTASQPIVKKYVADLYQTGTDIPVATELFNNTGVAFTYDYIAPGVYAVIASKNLFTNIPGQRIQATIGNATFIYDITGPTGQSVTIFPVFVNVMIILTTDLTLEVDDILGNNTQNTIEITIYP